jgi:hypothetical protein
VSWPTLPPIDPWLRICGEATMPAGFGEQRKPFAHRLVAGDVGQARVRHDLEAPFGVSDPA